MNKLSCKELPKIIDISSVRTDVTYEEIKSIAEIANRYNFKATFAMPCFTEMLHKCLGNNTSVILGGVAGFPSGADTTESKVECAKKMKAVGCGEIDMVINVGALKSKDYELVKRDIAMVVEAVYPLEVKTILEICYLTNEEIIKASEIAVDAGTTYIKTGTGWGNKPTTVETIKTIKSTIKDRAKIKAAGGVRTIEDIDSMIECGCDRFGVGIKSILTILKNAYERDNLEFNEPLFEKWSTAQAKY